MRQDNTIYTFSIKNIFLKYRTRQIKATKTNKVNKERYLIRQENTIYKFSIKNIFLKYRTKQIKATNKNKVNKEHYLMIYIYIYHYMLSLCALGLVNGCD